LVSTDGAWGKVTGEIDARALDVFAYLWHIVSYQRLLSGRFVDEVSARRGRLCDLRA
jgi:hypothetical protein